jgi:hypothetical protein
VVLLLRRQVRAARKDESVQPSLMNFSVAPAAVPASTMPASAPASAPAKGK